MLIAPQETQKLHLTGNPDEGHHREYQRAGQHDNCSHHNCDQLSTRQTALQDLNQPLNRPAKCLWQQHCEDGHNQGNHHQPEYQAQDPAARTTAYHVKLLVSSKLPPTQPSEAEQECEDRTVVAMFQVSRPLCKTRLSNAHDETSRCWPLAPALGRLCLTPQHSAVRVILRLAPALKLVLHLRSVRP